MTRMQTAGAALMAFALAGALRAGDAAPGTERAMPKTLVLCLDGTWNSTYDEQKRTERGDTVLKPTNVLKMCRAVLPRDATGSDQISYYDTGVGSQAEYPGFTNKLLAGTDKILGGAWGAGFE